MSWLREMIKEGRKRREWPWRKMFKREEESLPGVRVKK